jgi:Flp pilus assembly protein TadD
MAWNLLQWWRTDRAYAQAAALLRAGKPAEAAKAFDQVIAAYPRHARAHAQRALALAAAGHVGEAVRAARRAAELAPDNHAPLLFLGQIHYDAGQLEEARKAFSAALRLDPDNRLVKAYLGLTLLAMGRTREGAELLRPHLLDANEGLEARVLTLAETYLWARRDEARPLESQLTPDEGGRESRPAGLGARLASAIRTAFAWPLARLQGRARAKLLEAEEAMSLRDFQRAAAALAEAEMAGADPVDIALGLAEVHLEAGNARAAAEQVARLPAEVRQQPEVAALVGAALFEAGRYEEAREPLATAARRFTREFLPCYYRGMCEIALGRPQAAREWFLRAVQRLNPHLAQKRLEEMLRVAGEKAQGQA